MKFLFLIILICTLAISSQAAVARGFYGDPEFPGKCVINGRILSPGEVAQFSKLQTPGKESQIPIGCGRMICYANNEIEFHTCGLLAPPSGYRLGEPIMPTADYPKCCKRSFIPIN